MTPHPSSYFYLLHLPLFSSSFFFFNDTATTEIYTLSLHDALPIFGDRRDIVRGPAIEDRDCRWCAPAEISIFDRSEEHTSELQSLAYLVCRLLLEKKKYYKNRCPDGGCLYSADRIRLIS